MDLIDERGPHDPIVAIAELSIASERSSVRFGGVMSVVGCVRSGSGGSVGEAERGGWGEGGVDVGDAFGGRGGGEGRASVGSGRTSDARIPPTGMRFESLLVGRGR